MAITSRQPVTLESLSASDRASFVAILGGIFEHSPWIAEAAWEGRPFASVDALHEAMAKVVRDAPRERQLALIMAHPELAGREAAEGSLTPDSRGEQASAGLDRCTRDELKRLRELNAAYRQKFGFPFVMAIKGRTRGEIFQALEARMQHGTDEEF